MASTPPFQHQPLPTSTSIRVLVLHPGQPDSQLQCSIITSDIDHLNNLYDAVSYVWGDPSPQMSSQTMIQCTQYDSQPESQSQSQDTAFSPFPITPNLASFLRHLRSPSHPHTLWIDSICISQDNLAELTQQVSLMGTIYRRARTVLIWLGEETPSSNFPALLRSIDLLYELFPRNEEILAYTDVGRGTVGPLRNYDAVQARFGLPGVDAEEFGALDRLWRNAWFERAWTFQESVLARKKRFYFGKYSVDGKRLLGAYLTSVMLNFATDGEIFFNSYSARNMDYLTAGGELAWNHDQEDADQVEPRTDLLTLLYKRRGAQCQRPCDVVYSLLSLIKNHIKFELDYEKDFRYVYAEVAFDIIRHRQDLNIFNQAQLPYTLSELPSWVPDWRVKDDSNKDSNFPLRLGDIHLYRCTGSSKPQCSMSPDGKRLMIHGQEADRIYALCSVSSDNVLEQFLVHHLDFSLVDREYMYTPQERLSDAVARILCCDINYPERPKRGYGERWTAATDQALVKMLENHDNGTDLEEVPALQVRMRDQVQGCWWMITDGGRVGIAPTSAQVGDIVTLMPGGRVPLLLRECADVYLLVGECFVDQIMDGELFSKQHLLPPSRDFVLI